MITLLPRRSTARLVAALLSAGFLLLTFCDFVAAQRIAPEGGPSQPKQQRRTGPAGMDPEAWEKLTPQQRQEALSEYDRRMNPSPDALRNAQERIDNAVPRSQDPVMRQAPPAQAGCLPNDREERRPTAACGLTVGTIVDKVPLGGPQLGTAIFFCRYYVIAGACTERCQFVRCREAGEP